MAGRRKWAPVFIITAAWGLFLASFFLPATNMLSVAGTSPGTPLTGWQAFTSSMIHGVMNPWLWILEPRVFLYLVYPFANLLMLITPKLAFDSPDTSLYPALILMAFGVIPWLLPTTLTGDLFFGFYCWNGSYFLMAFGCITAPYHFHPEGK